MCISIRNFFCAFDHGGYRLSTAPIVATAANCNPIADTAWHARYTCMQSCTSPSLALRCASIDCAARAQFTLHTPNSWGVKAPWTACAHLPFQNRVCQSPQNSTATDQQEVLRRTGAPEISANLPAGHAVQAVAPTSGWNVPAGHGWQALPCDLSTNAPGGHC